MLNIRYAGALAFVFSVSCGDTKSGKRDSWDTGPASDAGQIADTGALAEACDTSDTCPADACQVAACVDHRCVTTTAPNGSDCNLSACIEDATCQNGTCSGSPKDCSTAIAGMECRSATCDEKTGECVVAATEDGTPCIDDNVCTEGNTCAAGVCSGGSPLDCVLEEPWIATGGADLLLVSGFHACARTTHGKAFCWGEGGSGQLGAGGVEDHTTASAVRGGLRFAQLTAGAFHTCGITDDERLGACWGKNDNGQLGNGDSGVPNWEEPLFVVGSPQFSQIDSGEYHSCGIQADDGALFCWGSNEHGQIGNNSSVDAFSPLPVSSIGASDWLQVSAGQSHTCAVADTDNRLPGRVYCWGSNNAGQLGLGTTEEHDTPQGIDFPTDGITAVWTQVSAGFNSTCARRNDGALFCWGNNAFGQLGDGTTSERRTPTRVGSSTAWSRVELSDNTGLAFGCGIKTGGDVECWGNGGFGQLGDGTTTSHNTPAPIDLDEHIVQVSAGPSSACAIALTGEVYCWGRNASRSLGVGTASTKVPTPTLVEGIED